MALLVLDHLFFHLSLCADRQPAYRYIKYILQYEEVLLLSGSFGDGIQINVAFFVSLPGKNNLIMIAAMDIRVTKTERSKLQDINFDKLVFGRYFTDYML